MSVSYDVSLLDTHQLILQGEGHEVVSALGFMEALKQCQSSKKFDLFIVGHSIPHADKEALISAFRADCAAPIIALTHPSEKPLCGADCEIEPDPRIVVEAVKSLTFLKAEGVGVGFVARFSSDLPSALFTILFGVGPHVIISI